MSGKCIGCFVIKLNISRNLGKKEFFCQVLLFLEYSLEKSYSWLIHWDSRCEPWLLWPGKDRSWKKDDDLPSIHTYVQQHLEEYGWRLLDWPHQQRNHEWKKSHANQSIFFHYPCLQKINYWVFWILMYSLMILWLWGAADRNYYLHWDRRPWYGEYDAWKACR